MKKYFYIFRHGQTDWNKEKRLQGSQGVPLNATGQKQAHNLGQSLMDKKIEIILSSPAERAAQTASIVQTYLKVPVEHKHELRPASFGILEGKQTQLFNEHENYIWQQVTNFDTAYDHIAPPEGESKESVKKRTLELLTTFAHQTDYTIIGISTHSFLIKLMLLAKTDTHYTIANCQTLLATYDIKENTWKITK